MKAYLDILSNVKNNGQWKSNRTGVRTLVLSNQHFSHDMHSGFPLLTTKRVAFKTMATELEGFIGGVTSKKWYKDRGCNIWNEWANPKAVDLAVRDGAEAIYDADMLENPEYRKLEQERVDDLGPIYGYQWRKFNAVYDEDDNGTMETYDQFDEIIQKLKTNPDDRRLVCSAWNPVQLSRMALPPCHLVWILTHINGYLHLHWTQRSCDLFLGVPFNVASYGLLLELLCKESGLKPGNLSGMLCDCHIYEDHLEAVDIQLARGIKPLPSFGLTTWNGIYNWKATDCIFNNYDPYPSIKAKVAV